MSGFVSPSPRSVNAAVEPQKPASKTLSVDDFAIGDKIGRYSTSIFAYTS